MHKAALLLGLIGAVALTACDSKPAAVGPRHTDEPTARSRPAASAEEVQAPVNKTDQEWRAQLTAEQYHITREKGTEPAFAGKYWNHKGKGTYRCVCCGAVLFRSDSKFGSGCGWPSFTQPADEEKIAELPDHSHGMVRTEVQCSRCGAHLGHVFDDGPEPTGLRYCINSAALDFENAKSDGE